MVKRALNPFVWIVAATLAAYAPALSSGFVWNDSDYVTRPELRSLHGLARIWREVGATEQYYPVLHTAFWVEHRLWGDAPIGYHLLNVLLHAAAAVLLGLAVKELLASTGSPAPDSRQSNARGEKGKAWAGRVGWLAALLFALHPVFVESVAWISEEKNTLSTVFYLLAALTYLRFSERRTVAPYLCATVWFILALLSKSVTASLPAALVLALWWRRGRLSWSADIAPLLPWFALGATSGLFTAWVERVYIGAHGSAYGLSLSQRFLLAGRVVWFYLGKLVWPANLVFIYPRWTIHPGDAIGWIAMIGILATTAFLWRSTRAGFSGWLFFCGSLFPVLGFFNVYAFRYSYVADHWQYLAAIGIVVPAAAVLAKRRTIAFLIAGIFGALTWRQTQTYHDSERLYRTTLDRNPRCWMASQNLASLELESGRIADAIAQFEETLRIAPELADAENNLGVALERAGRREEGIAHLRRALELKPDYLQADVNLGLMLLSQNRTAEAIGPFEAAVRLNPEVAEIQDKLAIACASEGRWDEAVARLKEAIRLRPDYADAHFRLALVYWRLGRQEEAIAQRREALRLDPSLPQ